MKISDRDLHFLAAQWLRARNIWTPESAMLLSEIFREIRDTAKKEMTEIYGIS